MEKKESQLQKRILNGLKIRSKRNCLHMQDNVLRKGINPRTKSSTVTRSYPNGCWKIIDEVKVGNDVPVMERSGNHLNTSNSDNHTALPCPGELLVEEHHSNIRGALVRRTPPIHPTHVCLRLGANTLRVGSHFIRYLSPEHYHCPERD
ncbi:hypothetical protein NC652_012476 [Populus alba x Populus x berolinensis]|nr:hypothetical protein NC652_012476 [Populus alba x Populus x berolinensis]